MIRALLLYTLMGLPAAIVGGVIGGLVARYSWRPRSPSAEVRKLADMWVKGKDEV